ncbi:hypothetical protein D3C75_1078050 [compost metagenome]
MIAAQVRLLLRGLHIVVAAGLKLRREITQRADFCPFQQRCIRVSPILVSGRKPVNELNQHAGISQCLNLLQQRLRQCLRIRDDQGAERLPVYRKLTVLWRSLHNQIRRNHIELNL